MHVLINNWKKDSIDVLAGFFYSPCGFLSLADFSLSSLLPETGSAGSSKLLSCSRCIS